MGDGFGEIEGLGDRFNDDDEVLLGLGYALDIAAEEDCGEIAEVIVGWGGDVGGFGDFVGDGEGDFADRFSYISRIEPDGG